MEMRQELKMRAKEAMWVQSNDGGFDYAGDGVESAGFECVQWPCDAPPKLLPTVRDQFACRVGTRYPHGQRHMRAPQNLSWRTYHGWT